MSGEIGASFNTIYLSLYSMYIKSLMLMFDDIQCFLHGREGFFKYYILGHTLLIGITLVPYTSS